MKKKVLYLLILVLSVFCLFACKKEEEGEKEEAPIQNANAFINKLTSGDDESKDEEEKEENDGKDDKDKDETKDEVIADYDKFEQELFDKVAKEEAEKADEDKGYEYYGRIKYKTDGYMYVFEDSGVKVYISDDYNETVGVLCCQNMDNIPDDTFYSEMESTLSATYGSFEYVKSYDSKQGYKFNEYKFYDSSSQLEGFVLMCLEDNCFVAVIGMNESNKISSYFYKIMDSMYIS